MTLPDSALIHGRMLVAAWDMGLDQGCQDKAIKLVLEATQTFLKQLVAALVSNRKGYRLRESKSMHSIGLPTLNPWLHNAWWVKDSMSDSYATEVNLTIDPSHVPSLAHSAQKAERDSAFYIACCDDNDRDLPLQPISVLDLFQTLSVKKNIIRCHTVYAVNMERISGRLNQPFVS